MALNFTCFRAAMAAFGILALPVSSHAIDVVFGQVASQTNPTSAANAKGMATLHHQFQRKPSKVALQSAAAGSAQHSPES